MRDPNDPVRPAVEGQTFRLVPLVVVDFSLMRGLEEGPGTERAIKVDPYSLAVPLQMWKTAGYLIAGILDAREVAHGKVPIQRALAEVEFVTGSLEPKPCPFSVVKCQFFDPDGKCPPFNRLSMNILPRPGILMTIEHELWNGQMVCVVWEDSIIVSNDSVFHQMGEFIGVHCETVDQFLSRDVPPGAAQPVPPGSD